MVSKKGYVAIKQPIFKKIETTITGGIARVSMREDVILSEMVMDAQYDGKTYLKGDKILITADAGTKPWAKKAYSLDDMEFVLCPETEILGFKKAIE